MNDIACQATSAFVAETKLLVYNDDYDAYLTRVLLFDRKLGDFEGLVDFGDFWELDLWLFGFFDAPWVTVLTENWSLCQLDADPWNVSQV